MLKTVGEETEVVSTVGGESELVGIIHVGGDTEVCRAVRGEAEIAWIRRRDICRGYQCMPVAVVDAMVVLTNLSKQLD